MAAAIRSGAAVPTALATSAAAGHGRRRGSVQAAAAAGPKPTAPSANHAARPGATRPPALCRPQGCRPLRALHAAHARRPVPLRPMSRAGEGAHLARARECRQQEALRRAARACRRAPPAVCMPKRPRIRSARAGQRPAHRHHQGEGPTAKSGRDGALARARDTVKCCQNPGQVKSEPRSDRIRTGGQMNRNPHRPVEWLSIALPS